MIRGTKACDWNHSVAMENGSLGVGKGCLVLLHTLRFQCKRGLVLKLRGGPLPVKYYG